MIRTRAGDGVVRRIRTTLIDSHLPSNESGRDLSVIWSAARERRGAAKEEARRLKGSSLRKKRTHRVKKFHSRTPLSSLTHSEHHFLCFAPHIVLVHCLSFCFVDYDLLSLKYSVLFSQFEFSYRKHEILPSFIAFFYVMLGFLD